MGGLHMKIPRFQIAAVVFLSSVALAYAAPGWSDNYAKSLELAKAGKKMVLLDFTGSDWCEGCMILDREIFSKQKFMEYANANLVLVKFDFAPSGEARSKQFAKQHEELRDKFRVDVYPTIIVLNSEGKIIGELIGYMEGGPEAFIAALEKLPRN